MNTRVRSLVIGSLASAVIGCGSSSGGGDGVATCSLDSQKQAVFDIMREWYFFNDEPEQQHKYSGLDLSGFGTPDSLLSFLRYRADQYDRNFSFITTAEADRQFFGEGQFVGFGFGTKFVDPPINSDLRFTQVFAGSPAAATGIQRGFRLLGIDGRSVAEINQVEGLSAALGPGTEGVTRAFRIRDLDGNEFDAIITKELVTIDPVPLTSVLDVNGARVGYVDLRTFIATAESELRQVFSDFETQGVTAVIIDLRYNGGGLVTTAQLLADLLGGFVADGQVLSQTRFNLSKSAENSVELFQRQAGSLSLLQQAVFITTPSSASASELVINAMSPHTVVTLVGGDTFGKPVGQSAFGYCNDEFLLRPVTFEVVNALGEGQFFDGLPADCSADDDLSVAVGDLAEESLATALDFLESGACPVVTGQGKLIGGRRGFGDVPIEPGAPAAQRFLRAF